MMKLLIEQGAPVGTAALPFAIIYILVQATEKVWRGEESPPKGGREFKVRSFEI